MLTTMWLLTVGGTMTIGFALVGRVAVDTAMNRVNLERARWATTGCARRVQSAIDLALSGAPNNQAAAEVWRSLHTAIDASGLLSGCDVALEAAGDRLDLNALSEESMSRLASAVVGVEHADEMADAFGDWRDTDSVTRPLGAEREWYAARGRVLPANGPFDDARELGLVRGFETFSIFDSLVSTEPGRVSLASAPATVLLAIPGISRELAERIVERRRTTPVLDLADMSSSISEAAAAELQQRYADASRLTTPDPDAWLLTVRATIGMIPVTSTLQWRVVRAGRQARILRAQSVM
jgi:type II secretory pathway component PulK